MAERRGGRRKVEPVRPDADEPAGPGAGAPGARGGGAAESIGDRPDPTAAASPAEVPLLSNGQLARIFHEIGDMLEVQGELVFKTVAYHRAADAIAHSPVEVAVAYREGRPPRIAGVGAAISKKLEELATTGHLAFYEKLRAQVPPSLVELLEVPGVGPRTVKLLYEQRGIESLDDLRHAAEAGHLRDLRGMSERTEAAILDGIAQLERRQPRLHLGEAERIVGLLVSELSDTPDVTSIVPAGSFRRRSETIGDLDLLVATADPQAIVERFVGLPSVDKVLGGGPHKASVRLLNGPQVDLMVMPPAEEGTYLVHFTGSKEHNVRLRSRARDRGWSLSEKGYLRLGPDGEPATGADAQLRTFPTEAEAYRFLDLEWIPPELREDRGEVEAAASGTLPRLVELADLRGDCHTHSDWSDGVHTIEQMAVAGRARGYAYQVLTDHTVSLGIAHGLDRARVEMQRGIIAELNDRFAREAAETVRAGMGRGGTGRAGSGPAASGPAASGRAGRGRAVAGTAEAAIAEAAIAEAAAWERSTSTAPPFRLLHGCELEIRADATLDYPDDLLASFDVVVASLHVSRRQPRAQLMARVIAALRSPHVDILAHPAGRVIGGRDDLGLDWDAVYDEAARTGTLLEVNGSDHRLDLSDTRAHRAGEHGCLLTIDSDAHRIEELDSIRWGVDTARRGWVEAGSVANTWPLERLLEWVGQKPDRVG